MKKKVETLVSTAQLNQSCQKCGNAHSMRLEVHLRWEDGLLMSEANGDPFCSSCYPDREWEYSKDKDVASFFLDNCEVSISLFSYDLEDRIHKELYKVSERVSNFVDDEVRKFDRKKLEKLIDLASRKISE